MDHANRQLYEAFGSLIRRRRRALELTQDELAERVGMSRGALANIETGRQNVMLHHLYRFARMLDIDIHDLLPDLTATLGAAQSAKPEHAPALPLPEGLTATQQKDITRLLTAPSPRKRSTTG